MHTSAAITSLSKNLEKKITATVKAMGFITMAAAGSGLNIVPMW